jgi:hypothetical protein
MGHNAKTLSFSFEAKARKKVQSRPQIFLWYELYGSCLCRFFSESPIKEASEKVSEFGPPEAGPTLSGIK